MQTAPTRRSFCNMIRLTGRWRSDFHGNRRGQYTARVVQRQRAWQTLRTFAIGRLLSPAPSPSEFFDCNRGLESDV